MYELENYKVGVKKTDGKGKNVMVWDIVKARTILEAKEEYEKIHGPIAFYEEYVVKSNFRGIYI